MLNTDNKIDLYDDVSNPLDCIEEIMLNNDWTFERQNEDEMSVQVTGTHGTYQMVFVWQDNYSAMQFCCAPDIKIAPNKMAEASITLNKINTGLWLGHFDIRADGNEASDFIPCFRHTSLFRGMTDTSGVAHIEDLIDIALHECERYYLSFELLAKVEHACKKDMSLALMDVAGLS